MKPRPAIFLDRDGVIIDDVHHLSAPAQVRLLPGIAETIAALNRGGWPVVVITNQSGVARGLFTEEVLHAVHRRIEEKLAAHGARVDAFYYCPHFPTAEVPEYGVECECRKPKPGLLHQAAADMNLDLSRSWMIGDRETDLQAGAAAGARTILVRTGYGASTDVTTLDRVSLRLELVARDLADAVAKCGFIEPVRLAA